MEHRGHIAEASRVWVVGRADTQCYHHERNLRNCREGKHALDVCLCTGHHCRIECSECSHVCYYVQHLRRKFNENGEHARHQVDTRYDHRRRMYECRYGSGAFHCVGQPYVQREHCTLSRAANEHQSQRNGNHNSRREEQSDVGLERECPRVVAIEKYSHEEKQIGEAGDDEGFFRCGNRCLFRVVESNEQIRRYAHKFPENVHLKDVRGNHKAQHRECEERQECIVALETLLSLHIAE